MNSNPKEEESRVKSRYREEYVTMNNKEKLMSKEPYVQLSGDINMAQNIDIVDLRYRDADEIDILFRAECENKGDCRWWHKDVKTWYEADGSAALSHVQNYQENLYALSKKHKEIVPFLKVKSEIAKKLRDNIEKWIHKNKPSAIIDEIKLLPSKEFMEKFGGSIDATLGKRKAIFQEFLQTYCAPKFKEIKNGINDEVYTATEFRRLLTNLISDLSETYPIFMMDKIV
jgi:hypothetical protein